MPVYFARVSVTHCHTILSLQFHFQFRTIMLPEKICQKVLRLIFYWSGLLINVNNRLDNMTIKTHKFQTNVIINSSRGLSKHTFSVFDTIEFIEFFRHYLFRHRATKIACYTAIFLFYGVSVLFRTSFTILIVI